VVGVLRPAQPGFNDGEPGLHEHDEEPGNERPHEVDGNTVLPRLIDRIRKRDSLGGVSGHDIVDRAGLSPPGVALGQIVSGRGLGRFGIQRQVHLGPRRRGRGCRSGWRRGRGLRPDRKAAQDD